MTTTYSQPQFLALRTLAGAYGHGWATEPDMPKEHPSGPECLWTQSLIRECYEAIGQRDGWESWQFGISAPEESKNNRGPVCHTTGSGRLTWQVDADGVIGLVISRPGPDRGFGPTGAVVLSARVRDGRVEEIRTPDTHGGRIPDVYMVTAWWSDEAGPRAEARHGDELLRALAAVVGRDVALAAIDHARVPRSPIDGR